MKKFIQIILFLTVANCFLLGDTEKFPNIPKDFLEMTEHSVTNLQNFGPQLAGITLTTGILVGHYDEKIRFHLVDRQKKRFRSNALNAMTLPAKGYGKNSRNLAFTFGGLTAAHYLYGKIAEEPQSVETAYLLIESAIITGGIIEAGKVLLGRARPFNNIGAKSFAPLNFRDEHHSLPSGHTGIAFVMATTVAMSHDSYWIKIPCYLWATSAGLQRIGYDVHWTSDVLIGGLIGYGVSAFLHDNYYKDRSSNTVRSVINIVIPL